MASAKLVASGASIGMLGAADAPYPRPIARWWLVSVFSIAGLIAFADRVILAALVDPLRRDLRISDTQVSVLQGAAFAVVYVLAGLPLGRLADRKRRVTMIMVGATIWSIGTISCGLASSFLALFVARLMVGIGEAALPPAAISAISDACPPAQRGMGIGMFIMGMIVGGSVAVVVGDTLLGAAQHGIFAHWGVLGAIAPWRLVLLLVGLAGLAVPIFCLTIREPVRREIASSGRVSVREAIAQLLSQRGILIPLYVGMALLSIGDYGILSWAPTVFSRRFLLAPVYIGTVFGIVSGIGSVAGSLAGGVASDAAERRGGTRVRLALLSGVSLLGCLGAICLSRGSQATVFAGLGVWMFASMLAGTAGIAAVIAALPNEVRGVGVSLVAFCNTLLGLGLGPTIVAVTTERVYRDPLAVGLAITTTVAPAALIAAILFGRSSLRVRATTPAGLARV